MDRDDKGLRVPVEHQRDGRHPRRKAELPEAVAHIGQMISSPGPEDAAQENRGRGTALSRAVLGAGMCYVIS